MLKKQKSTKTVVAKQTSAEDRAIVYCWH